jgi:carboxyl-terminal processing protease
MQVMEINGEATEEAVRSIEPKFLSREDPAAREWALQVALAGRRDREIIRLLTRMGDSLREFAFVPGDSEPTSMLSYRVIRGLAMCVLTIRLASKNSCQPLTKSLRIPDVQALVIDLRDTPSGGNSAVARGIMGRLVDKMLPYQRHEVVSEFRSTGIRRVWDEYVAPRGSPFLKPIVVLVGRWTGSMGEGLAIGLNATRGAMVLGQPMAHLAGANGEAVLPHSKIVRARSHREALSHRRHASRGHRSLSHIFCDPDSLAQDGDLGAAIALALNLSALKSNDSLQSNCYGLRPPHAAELIR